VTGVDRMRRWFWGTQSYQTGAAQLFLVQAVVYKSIVGKPEMEVEAPTVVERKERVEVAMPPTRFLKKAT
jgi:hypothetical protein